MCNTQHTFAQFIIPCHMPTAYTTIIPVPTQQHHKIAYCTENCSRAHTCASPCQPHRTNVLGELSTKTSPCAILRKYVYCQLHDWLTIHGRQWPLYPQNAIVSNSSQPSKPHPARRRQSPAWHFELACFKKSPLFMSDLGEPKSCHLQL